MAFTGAGPGAPSVFAGSPGELLTAYLDLSSSSGGTIYLTGDFPSVGEISLSGGGSAPVHITSADPVDPVLVSRIDFDGVDNVRVSDVRVDGSAVERPEWHRDLDINGSSRIEISDSTFTSNGSPFYDPDDPTTIVGERLGMVRNSEDITVSNSYFAGYEHGITFQESSEIRVISNEITAIQGDGLRLTGVQEVLIADNYMHDFYSTPNEYTHSDFIQLWSTNAETVSSDITVTGNVLDTGNGVSVQGIWMRNEQHDKGNPDYVYQNITITDNLIYTGSANGIGVGQADNVLVANNTLLWNQGAYTIKETGDTSYFPRIRLHEDITNAQVIDNITTRILHGEEARLDGNVLISWDPADPNYVGHHFTNATDGGDIGPEGWKLLETSPWAGKGASASQTGGGNPRILHDLH